MKSKVITTFMLLISFATTFAQKGVEDGSKYGHGEDSIRCGNNLSLFVEYAKQDNYKDAVEPWTICYNECPSASAYIYSEGENIIKWQIKTAQTAEDREQYKKDLLALYDQRIKYYGNSRKYPEAYILGKKALTYYTFYGKTTEGQKESMEMLDTAIGKLMGKFSSSTAKTLLGSIQTFMVINFNLFSRNEITSETLISNYEKSQDQLAKLQKATSKLDDEINGLRDAFEKNFANSGAADCETLVNMYTSKVAEGKNDKELLEKVLNLFDKMDCTESELYYQAAEYLHAIEPSASSAYGIAKMYLNPATEDIDKALEFYHQALKLEKDQDRQADYLFQMALITFSKKKNKVKARDFCKQAMTKRANWGKPLILIGQMYAASAAAQELGSKDIENTAGYWAAVDKFMMAKKVDPESATEANQQIKIFSNYFPNTEQIFFEEGFELNKPYFVGGWIKESTICRPKQ